MRRILLYILVGLCVTGGFSCKKVIDRQKENLVMSLMTNGRWYLETITENGFDITYQFSGYEFQFYENGKLDAFRGASVQSGTWTGDLNNLTFNSTFPASSYPLEKLNQVWKIKDYYIDLVFAETSAPGGLITIRFRKK